MNEGKKEIKAFNLEDETYYLLIESILDSLEQFEESEEESFSIIYYKDQISYEQFKRICKTATFILESFFPFPHFEKEEYEKEGTEYIRIKTSDDEGLLHTCFFEILFSHNDEYIIQYRTCVCDNVYERLNLFLPSILSLDIFKIWICLQSSDNIPKEFEERFKSLLKMYAGSNYVESMTHIGYLAEQITRKIYLNKYQDKTEDEVKSENWSRLLKRLQSEKDEPFIQHSAFLIDSIRPLRNEILHHDYNPTSSDVEFGIQCIIRLFNLFFNNS